jgi:hypothetical protein
MDNISDKFEKFKNRAIKAALIIHEKSKPDSPDHPEIVSRDDGLIEIRVGGEIPPSWFVDITRNLTEMGIQQIDLQSWGWWLGSCAPPAIVKVTDHVACYLPNILTGSESAKAGKAFVNMKGAYEHDDGEGSVLWHTSERIMLSTDEIEIAKSAACVVASPDVAPWTIAARVSECRLSATVKIDPEL